MLKSYSAVCNKVPLVPIFDLGEHYVSAFLDPGEKPNEESKHKLEIGFDYVNNLAQLTSQPEAKYMWGSMYNYYSGTNPKMVKALKDVVDAALARVPRLSGAFLDIASNDGTLLSKVPTDFLRVGVDPSDYKKFNKPERFDIQIQDFFSAESYFAKVSQKAQVVTCCAMFYDLSNPVEFLNDIAKVMVDDGLAIIQLSYTPIMDKMLEVGNICSEHLCYYSLISLQNVIRRSDMVLRDVELNNVNGGSIRLYLQKKNCINYMDFTEQIVAKTRIEALVQWEVKEGYNSHEPFVRFHENIKRLKQTTLDLLTKLKNEGKTVMGYGASTKANTLLQYYGIGPELISKIADRQPQKHGKVTVGTNIPIVSEEEVRRDNPDYLVVFPWFFISEFLKREKEYLDNGGRILVLNPTIREFSKFGEREIL